MEFMLGCNYQASNAGTEMWINWDETAVENDFKTLSENGLKYLRVFPNWRDFQPVCGFYGCKNSFKEYHHVNGELFDNPYFVDYEMFKRFEKLCDIAEKKQSETYCRNTYWMDERTFVCTACP